MHLEWIICYLRSKFQCKIAIKFFAREKFHQYRVKHIQKYVKREIYDYEKANNVVKKMIESGKPFALCRNGMGETDFIIQQIRDRIKGTNKVNELEMAQIFDRNSGMLQQYFELMQHCYSEADIVCVWTSIAMEEYLIKHYAFKAKLTGTGIVGVLGNDVWHSALTGKRVLVVSPFVKTMEEQYKKREYLHKDINFLPKFELITVEAIWWYEGGRDSRFASWFQVLDYMYEECMKKEFDIALVGCSTFSMPLVIKLKEAGKQAIQTGADLQLLFGIKGKRWDNRLDLDLYTEHWVYLPQETQLGDVNVIDHVEGGAYW